MPFDLLGWAIGFGLTSSARAASVKFFGRDLEDRIDATVTEWAQSHDLSPAALFPHAPNADDGSVGPGLLELRSALGSGRIPTTAQWHLALIEQWLQVRRTLGSSASEFFHLPEADARIALNALATAVTRQCEQDEVLFRGTVLRMLNDLAAGRHAPGVGVAVPFNWDTSPSIRALGRTIQETLNARVELVVIEAATNTIHIWADVPQGTVQERNSTLLNIATVASGVPRIKHIEIGIANAKPLKRTNARGPVGRMKIRFDARTVQNQARGLTAGASFWEQVKCFAIRSDNTPTQRWHESPFPRFEEWPDDEDVQTRVKITIDEPEPAGLHKGRFELEFLTSENGRLAVEGNHVEIHAFTMSDLGTAFFRATIGGPQGAALSSIGLENRFCVWPLDLDGHRTRPIWLSVSRLKPKVHHGGAVTLEVDGRGPLGPLIDSEWRDDFEGDLSDVLTKACGSQAIRIEGLRGRDIQLYADARSKYGALRMLAVSLGFVLHETPESGAIVFRSLEQAVLDHLDLLRGPMPTFGDDDITSAEWELGSPILDRDES